MYRRITTQGKKCIIIAAGELGIEKPPICQEDLCIAADGGYSYCNKLQIIPDYWIGDFDSLTEEEQQAACEMEKNQPEKIKRLPVVKDDTDMLAAIKLGLEKGYRRFYLYGGLGGARFEHSVANIQCLQYLKEHDAEGYLLGDRQMLMLVKEETITIPAGEELYVSVFSLSETATGVNLKHLKYELENAVLTNSFPIGISNETVGKDAVISVEKGSLLVVLTKKK